MRAISIALFLTMSLSLSMASAQAGGSKAPAQPEATHYYYDGPTKREITLDPDLVAEFTSAETQAKAAAPLSGMEPAGGHRGVRFWKINAESAQEVRSVSKQAGKASASKFSPVFRDAGGRRPRALPGGVILFFKKGWTEDQCRGWIAEKGLTIERKLTVGKPIYLVESPAGLASLELANRLHETGKLVGASPNWWTPVETK